MLSHALSLLTLLFAGQSRVRVSLPSQLEQSGQLILAVEGQVGEVSKIRYTFLKEETIKVSDYTFTFNYFSVVSLQAIDQ